MFDDDNLDLEINLNPLINLLTVISTAILVILWASGKIALWIIFVPAVCLTLFWVITWIAWIVKKER